MPVHAKRIAHLLCIVALTGCRRDAAASMSAPDPSTAGLTLPALPATEFAYSDAAVPRPAHFSAQVVDFCDSRVQQNPFLDARVKAPDGTPLRLGLTQAQKASLAAFLRTLTDSSFLTAPRFANPFVAPIVIPIVAAVTIQSNWYHPPTLTVTPGSMSTFTKLDNVRHSAQFDAAQITSTPIFTTGTQSVTVPSVAGTYTYHCAVHGLQMQGSSIVR